MSKNDNLKTRPGTLKRRRPKPQAPAPSPEAPVKQSRLRRFLPTVVIPHAVALLLVIVGAVAALMFTSTSMVNLPATIAQLWLALNMGVVSGSGEVVGVMPMVPAMIFAWALISRIHRAVKERVSIADLGVLAALTLGVPLSLTAVVCFMLHDASAVLNVGVPPLTYLLRILLLHSVILVFGMGPKLWRALARRYRVPEWLIDAAAVAIRFLLTYAAVATLMALVMIAVNHSVFTAALTGHGDSGAVFALLVLSVAYLPNIVVYAMGMLVGAPLYFGEAAISVFSVHLVPLPPLPVLAAIPLSAPEWAVALLLVPASVAAWVCLKNPMRLRVSLSAAGFAAVFFLILTVFAGGPLGVYGYVGLNRPAAVGLLLGYLLLVPALIAGIDRLRAGAGPLGRPAVLGGVRAGAAAADVASGAGEKSVAAVADAGTADKAGVEAAAEQDGGSGEDAGAGEGTAGTEGDSEVPEDSVSEDSVPPDVQQLTEPEGRTSALDGEKLQANDFTAVGETTPETEPDPAPEDTSERDAESPEDQSDTFPGTGAELDDGGSTPHGR